ncbi:hypothetical protein AJ78_04792 [Emergomyces pasteurianus Ep9510]|uniref:Uncharacterized protein n=1 Tax=Emergomyces pasteurianus Ep9510 TaxID=1447872 RepID=A0A1J9Q3Z0_9EURO|nr:hypothetical protein AJ78_04792 [Emergomyces pasteurianus Ep9510]
MAAIASATAIAFDNDDHDHDHDETIAVEGSLFRNSEFLLFKRLFGTLRLEGRFENDLCGFLFV